MYEGPMPWDMATIDNRIAELRAILPIVPDEEKETVVKSLHVHLGWRKQLLTFPRTSGGIS